MAAMEGGAQDSDRPARGRLVSRNLVTEPMLEIERHYGVYQDLSSF